MSTPASLRWMGSLDMYRKVPADLMEGTKRGSALSLFAVFVMLVLFLLETGSYFQKTLVTDLSLDKSTDQRVRLNFNITMMDLRCDYTVVDVVSVLGTEQNVTAHINKWSIDAEGLRQVFIFRNKHQKDIALHDQDVKETMDELLENGEDAVSLDATTFEFALKEQNFLFVDFYASWCSHCRTFAPTWEVLGEVMLDVAEQVVDQHPHEYSDEEYKEAVKVALPVMIAKVDCVIHHDLCKQQQIMAYPTLRLFIDGQPWRGGDYRGDRTVAEMAHWLQAIEEIYKEEVENSTTVLHSVHKAARNRIGGDVSPEEQEWALKVKKRKKKLERQWNEDEHPGCRVVGHLMLDRVPGNFHIQARSPHHDMNPHMANLSHEIHHLSLGDPVSLTMLEEGKVAGVPISIRHKLTPMDGNVYVTKELHEAYHHYLKVVTTQIDGFKLGGRKLKAYQVLQSSQLSYYRNDLVPEAKFILDLSPIQVSYRTTSRHWYDYLTSLMAIIGGTFTVVGLFESGIYAAVDRRKRRL